MPAETLSTEKMLQTIKFELKSFNDEERSFMAIASDMTTDRHGEAISQDGWDLTNFRNNPVIPWGHDYYNPPVAKATEIGVVEGKLVMRVQFATADEYPFADTIYKLYRGGYLRAFSVGFIPAEMEGNTFTKQELLEVSAVTVPSNPNALALAYKEGVISETERKQLVTHLNAAIKSLTNLQHKHDTEAKEIEIDMEQVEKLLTEMKTELLGEIESLKSALTDVQEKMVVKTAEAEEEAEDEKTDDDAQADDDASDKSEDENLSDGAEDDAREVSAEEAEKIIADSVAKALADAKGQVE